MNPSEDQKQAIEVFSNFITDPEAFDMFITGQAGTGKTTILYDIVELLLHDKIPHVVCAYTHKAANVLRSKLPKETDIRTLHSFLRKRPGINENAKTHSHMNTTTQFGEPQKIQLLIVDEFSMVGEKDVLSIGELQDPDYTGNPEMKVLYVGDPFQIPPVGAPQVLNPERCKYHAHLTQVHRQEENSNLLDIICQIVDMIDTGETTKLEPNPQFQRGVNIISVYTQLLHQNKDAQMLAYTNRRVQQLNQLIYNQVKSFLPNPMMRWCPTLKQMIEWSSDITPESIDILNTPSGDMIWGSKYKTLEHLVNMSNSYPIEFGRFVDDEGESLTLAYVFGHGDYNDIVKSLKTQAVEVNQQIPSQNPKKWAQAHPHHKLSRRRAKIWRDLLTFMDCVVCVDYPFAMTVHKSQGSTYDYVLIDNEDLSITKAYSMETYLKLLYVGVSRASKAVFLNN